MYCKQCGTNLPEGTPACPNCGAAVTPPYAQPEATGPYTPPGQPAAGQQPYTPATPQPPIKPYTFPGAEAPEAPAEPVPSPALAQAVQAAAVAGADRPGGPETFTPTVEEYPAAVAPTPASSAPPYTPPAPVSPPAASFDEQAAPSEAFAPPAPGPMSWTSDGAPSGQPVPAAPPQYAPYDPYAAQPGGGQMPPGGPVPAWQPTPPAPAKKRRVGLIVAIALVAVACIVVLLVLLLGNDPKKQLRKGMENTFSTLASETAAATGKFGLDGFGDALGDGPAQVKMGMSADMQDELQMSMSGDVYTDYENEKAEMDMTLETYGATLEVQVGLDGDLIAVGLPGLLDQSYGLHTKTLGEDYNSAAGAAIRDMFGDLEVDPDFSYDPFENLGSDLDLDGAVSLTAAGTAIAARYDTLWNDITVTRDGSEDISVNGAVKNCAAYDVILPKEAFVSFLRDCLEILEKDAAQADTDDDARLTPEMLDTLEGMVDKVASRLDGDITGRCWLLGGQLVRAELAIPASGETYEATLQVGGENALGDAITFTVTTGNRTLFSYASEGDTTLKSGVYTNQINLQVSGSSGTTRVNIGLRFDPAAERDNFSCNISVPNVLLSATIEGTLRVDKATKTGTADLHTITVDVAGERLSMDFFYEISPSQGHTFAPVDPVMVFNMTEDELYDAYYELLMGFYFSMGLY